MTAPIHVILLMGVSGCGKSTVGHALSRALGWPFRDADSFHPASNIEKMSHGTPLTDEDRWPWLDAVAAWMHERLENGERGIVSCSALKRTYRDRLLPSRDGIGLVYLKGSIELIEARLARRHGHFMPVSLLQSQFAALEEPDASERPLGISITAPPEEIVTTIIDGFGLAKA